MGNEISRNMTKDEIAGRVARFDQLQPMSTSKDMADVPQEAMDIIFARKLMPVFLEKRRLHLAIAPQYLVRQERR